MVAYLTSAAKLLEWSYLDGKYYSLWSIKFLQDS